MRCKLCNKNDANQTGSHIIPAFLLTSQIGKRDEERGFLITTNPNQNIAENKEANHIKEDYIFCRDCEKRLSYVENYYSVEITQKIEEDKFKDNFEEIKTKHGIYLTCNRINPIAFHLFIYSNIWRAAVSNQPIFKHFELPSNIVNELQFLLDLFLPNTVDHKIKISLKQWINDLENCKEFFSVFPYIILKAEKLEDKELTYEFFDNITHFPNHIILNEYIIFPFFQEVQWKEDFFQYRDEIDFEDLLNNSTDQCKMGIISNKRYLSTIELIQNMVVKERMEKLEKICIMELAIHGIPINQENISKLLKTKVNQSKK